MAPRPNPLVLPSLQSGSQWFRTDTEMNVNAGKPRRRYSVASVSAGTLSDAESKEGFQNIFQITVFDENTSTLL